jgi:hypothetical protein
MYWSPYTEPTVIRIDQTTKLIPIQVITLPIDDPSNSAVKAAISVPSNEGESKANIGRPYFSQICLALVSLFEGSGGLSTLHSGLPLRDRLLLDWTCLTQNKNGGSFMVEKLNIIISELGNIRQAEPVR